VARHTTIEIDFILDNQWNKEGLKNTDSVYCSKHLPEAHIFVFSTGVFTGHRRRAHRGAANIEEDTQIHGQVIYSDLLLRDDH